MENFILAAVPPTELTVWQCAFLGALGGLLFAAVCWYIYGKDTDIFFCPAYKCGAARQHSFRCRIGNSVLVLE